MVAPLALNASENRQHPLLLGVHKCSLNDIHFVIILYYCDAFCLGALCNSSNILYDILVGIRMHICLVFTLYILYLRHVRWKEEASTGHAYIYIVQTRYILPIIILCTYIL